MKKTYEKPVLMMKQFDVDDVITASGLDNRTHTWETNQVSTDTLAELGIQIH